MKRYMLSVFLVVVTFGVTIGQGTNQYIFGQNEKLGKGVNISSLESENPSAWIGNFTDTLMRRLEEQGFRHVRIPVRWDANSLLVAPYTINEEFFIRIDTIIDKALSYNLSVILNIHHDDALNADPTGNKARFLAYWNQISDRYSDKTDSLYFEILNEPHDNFTAALWNEFLADALDTIRSSNPARPVLIGTYPWGGVPGLANLELPEDTCLIATFHYYEPFHFTHQGASWVDNSEQWIGTKWEHTEAEQQEIISAFNTVKDFGEENNIPIHMGEYGSISIGDMKSRILWTAFCSITASEMGFSTAYWSLAEGAFGFYSPSGDMFIEPLLEALTTDTMPEPEDPIVDENNLVQNQDFKYWLLPWSFYAQGGALATASIFEETAKIEIKNPGTESWHAQFMYPALKMEEGHTYKLTFDAMAEDNITVGVGMGMNKDPWTTYSSMDYNFTAEWQTFTMDFYMTHPTDLAGRIAYNMGGKLATNIYIDNVYFEEIIIPAESLEITTER